MILKNKNILIISPEPWGTNFVSKHHYASELSKLNIVFFLNPPTKKFSAHEVNPNLRAIDYKPIVRGINRFPQRIRDYLNSINIRKIKKICGVPDFDIIWSFDPFRFQNLSLFNSQLQIYHPVDFHYTPHEKEISNSAHIILTTCNQLKEKLDNYNARVHNIGHGVSERFINNQSQDNKRKNRIKVCMMGNLQRGIDYQVLFKAIEGNQDAEFHFVGPCKSSNLSQKLKFSSEIEKLKSYNNTYLHGSIPQSNLPGSLRKMDLFLILYREDENPASKANPHKLLEYMGSGKPILSSWMDEHENMKELIEMVRDNKDFPDKLRELLDNYDKYNSNLHTRNRILHASKNTYTAKIELIGKLAENIK